MSSKPAPPIHVLVVDDSAVVRQTLLRMLSAIEDMTVETAADPIIAMEKMQQRWPDVVVLDLEMPRMDGITFIRKIMRERPLPIIVCSGHVEHGSDAAVRALGEGAVDVISKPRIGLKDFLNDSAVMLADSIRGAAMVNHRRLRARALEGMGTADAVVPRLTPARTALKEGVLRRDGFRVIAIGASTGGPDVIWQILRGMPPAAPGIVVVQHMPEVFTASFARHLDKTCGLRVKEAEPGDEIVAGQVFIARGDRHLVVYRQGARFLVDVVRGPLVSRHRPSVDVLFRSVAQTAGHEAIAVLLTGMGEDGAAGLLELKESGALTIAESEESCAVFGMPRAAIMRGAAAEILPASEIAMKITQELQLKAKDRRPK